MISYESKNFLDEMKDFCLENLDNNLFFFDQKEASNISFSELFRSLVSYDFTDNSIRDLFISHLEQIQKYSPAAAAMVPYFLTLENLSYLKIPSNKEIISSIKEPSTKDIENIIQFFFKNSSLMNECDFAEIFKNNGFISKFEFKKSNNVQTACIFNTGFSVPSRITDIFFSAAKKESIELNEAEVILYDGVIESVSELNLILNKSFENKRKYIVFCRGAQEDVERTCAVNLGLSKAFVVLSYPEDSFWFDEEVNYLMDNLEIDLYGYRTGRLLNNFEFKKSKLINCTVDRTSVVIKDSNFKINKIAPTTLYLNENAWKKRGLIIDQTNFFNSIIEQISLCGVISRKKLSNIGINAEEIFNSNLEYYPAFPILRAIHESKVILDKLSKIGLIIKN